MTTMSSQVTPAFRNEARPRWARLGTASILGGLILCLASGCSREFFREWANADVTEAVFERSRDPRYRLDLFSIEPPAQSRFADPHDPDFPPAPPDDLAARALSTHAQDPRERVLVPTEGTGYIDYLERIKAEREAEEARAERESEADTGGLDDPYQLEEPLEGGDPADITPPPVEPLPLDPTINPELPGRPEPLPLPEPPADDPPFDLGVRSTAFQVPEPEDDPIEPGSQDDPLVPPTREALRQELDAANIQNEPESLPTPEDQERQRRVAEGGDSGIVDILNRGVREISEGEAAGLPSDLDPYVISPTQALNLALINSRPYQTQIESIYLTALPVTQQRFNLQPQLAAGLGQSQTAAGSVIGTPTNSFLYRTVEAPGGQSSTLNLGPAIGLGKVLSFGSSVLIGFANTVQFNFVGLNPQQPSVSSTIPVQVVLPLLRGGGRAVTLEALTQSERDLLYQIRTFARFRKQFFVSVLTGQGIPGAGADPQIGYLSVLQQLQVVKNQARNVQFLETLLPIYVELAGSPDTTIGQLQIDQVNQNLLAGQQNLLQAENVLQDLLEQYRIQIGLPPDVPVLLDSSVIAGFEEVFQAIERWAEDPQRDPETLEEIVSGLPPLQEIRLGEYNILESASDPEVLYDILLVGERIALENRLDLQNARGQLYDSWRQLRVTANALKSFLNISLTNQVFTPVTTSNPLAFLDQAKQFSITFNTDIPLVRVAERNAFQAARINYQQQRRALMQAEDLVKFNVRSAIRDVRLNGPIYDLSQAEFITTLKQKDNAIEELAAPPGPSGSAGNVATTTLNLIGAQNSVLGSQNALVNTFVNYQQQRLVLYRDLGIMPYDEWEAYDEFFGQIDDINNPPDW